MRSVERLTKLKKWMEKELCEGRKLKAPAKNMNIAEIIWKEPKCYLAWAPSRLEYIGKPGGEAYLESNVCEIRGRKAF